MTADTSQPSPSDSLANQDTIAILVLTHSRFHLLRKCVENVLARTSQRTREIVIWDNASTDETAQYLDSLTDERLKVVHHHVNIGQNAYRHAFELSTAPYLVRLDDDVVDAPTHWDTTLLHAFIRLPDIGYLMAKLREDEHDLSSRMFYGANANLYERRVVNGVAILQGGPVGGGATITSREICQLAGGFGHNRRLAFWHEAHDFIQRVERLGYGAAILDDLTVHHTGGQFYGASTAEKRRFYDERDRRRARRNRVKRMLLRVPFVASLNARYRWFQAPPAG